MRPSPTKSVIPCAHGVLRDVRQRTPGSSCTPMPTNDSLGKRRLEAPRVASNLARDAGQRILGRLVAVRAAGNRRAAARAGCSTGLPAVRQTSRTPSSRAAPRAARAASCERRVEVVVRPRRAGWTSPNPASALGPIRSAGPPLRAASVRKGTMSNAESRTPISSPGRCGLDALDDRRARSAARFSRVPPYRPGRLRAPSSSWPR